MADGSTRPGWSQLWPLLPEALLLAGGIVFAGYAWGVALAVTGAAAMLLTGVGWFLGGGLACTVPMAAAAAAAPISTGLLLAPDEPLTDALLGGGVVGLVLLALIPVALQIRGGQASRGQVDANVLVDIRDHVMLSDSAKRVLFRDRELELLQATIEDDIEACAFNRALVLCDDMERMLGASPEAEQLRERVLMARNRQLAAEIQRESETVMALLESGRWEEADRAAQRLHRLYPDSPALHGLQGRIAVAKGRWKRDLEASFHAAAERGEIEMAMELLRTLDRVLEPAEAEHIREVARGVVDQHRDTVSTRFKLAVSDHHWTDALQIGREIMREFPNDTMAEEVRKMVPTLESRAMEQH